MKQSGEVTFVKLPDYWIEQLHKSNNPGAFKLAHCILKEDFKRQYVGGEIVLSTKTTRLCRKVRSKAVKEFSEYTRPLLHLPSCYTTS